MSQVLLQRNLDTPGARLKYLRSILRLTRAYIEKKYNLPEITLKSWENSMIKISKNGIKRCVAVYKNEGLIVDESWIADGKGLDPTVRLSLGHYFAMPSEIVNLPIDADDEVAMMRDAQEFRERYSNAVVMIVSNDEMSPHYRAGDYVGGRLKNSNELDCIINKDCIIYLKGGGQYFRRLFKDSLGRFNLACLNPMGRTAEPIIFDADIESAAAVIWIRRKDE
jgi:hypothetical protein